MSSFWKRFKKGLFTKSQFITGVTITAMTSSVLVYAFTYTNWNTFISKSTISSAEVNNNFNYLKERIEYLAGDLVELEGTASPGPIASTGFSGASYFTLQFDSTVIEFDTTGLAANIIANNGFSVTSNRQYKVSLTAEMDTTVSTLNFGLKPMRRYIDSTGSTQYVSVGMGLSLYSNSGRVTESYTVNLQAGDFFYIGVENQTAGNVDLLPGYRFSIRKN